MCGVQKNRTGISENRTQPKRIQCGGASRVPTRVANVRAHGLNPSLFERHVRGSWIREIRSCSWCVKKSHRSTAIHARAFARGYFHGPHDTRNSIALLQFRKFRQSRGRLPRYCLAKSIDDDVTAEIADFAALPGMQPTHRLLMRDFLLFLRRIERIHDGLLQDRSSEIPVPFTHCPVSLNQLVLFRGAGRQWYSSA